MFQPQKGIENPIIRRAMHLCDESGMKVTYHEDSVEVWFAPNNKRFYTIWSQFLADAEAIFGDRLINEVKPDGQPRAGFGNRADKSPNAAWHNAPGAERHDSSILERHADGRAAEPHGASVQRYTNGATAERQSASQDLHVPPQVNGAASPYDEIAKLRTELRVLERAIKVVGMQREEWKREAETLKEQLEIVRTEAAQMAEARLNQAGPGVDRYKMVRQIIVRRLHPDIPGTDEEKSTREKLFKTIWSEIEVLDRK